MALRAASSIEPPPDELHIRPPTRVHAAHSQPSTRTPVLLVKVDELVLINVVVFSSTHDTPLARNAPQPKAQALRMAYTTHQLRNSQRGFSHCLQPRIDPPHPDALHLAPCSEADILWTFAPAPGNPGKWHISTIAPDGQPKRLDLYNDNSGDKTRIRLASPGYYSGQFWTLIPCVEEEKHGRWYKLSNDWTGPGWFLNVDAQTGVACMREGDHDGQWWFIDVPAGTVEELASGCCDVEAQTSKGAREWRSTTARYGSAVAIGFVLGSFWERFIM